MTQAGVVLDEMPGRATAVITGAETLAAVYEEAAQMRRDRTSDEGRFKRLPDDLAAMVRDETLTLPEAVAAAKEREAQAKADADAAERNAEQITDAVRSAVAILANTAHLPTLLERLPTRAIPPDVDELTAARDALTRIIRKRKGDHT